MACKKIFVTKDLKKLFYEELITFQYFPGFSTIQKHKLIESLHDNIKSIYGEKKILEISSHSMQELGKKLSAFNLKLKINDNEYFIENIFQASKVFDKGGPYTDLLYVSPVKAKKDERLRNSGKIIGFHFFGEKMPINPPNLFYDWIYCNALYQKKEIISELFEYSIFTDIEFNHEKSINCQARSAAIFVSLYRVNLLDYAMSSIHNFYNAVYNY